jgi:hypothetical protein
MSFGFIVMSVLAVPFTFTVSSESGIPSYPFPVEYVCSLFNGAFSITQTVLGRMKR